MSDADKTRRKLLDSVQKTKMADTAPSAAGESDTVKDNSSRSKTPKKSAAGSQSASAPSKARFNHRFHRKGRVWPD